jgi:hypothetical protein
MNRVRNWILTFLAAFTVAPTVALLAWYAVSFLPHLDELKSHALAGTEAEQAAMESIYPLAMAAEGEKGIRIAAVRHAYQSIVSTQGKPMVQSHINALLWSFASYIHLDEKEIFSLWFNCVLFGCDKGLPQASQIYYGRDISQLSFRERAGLVALVKAPGAYRPGSDRSEKRIDMILNQLKPHNTALQTDTRTTELQHYAY